MSTAHAASMVLQLWVWEAGQVAGCVSVVPLGSADQLSSWQTQTTGFIMVSTRQRDYCRKTVVTQTEGVYTLFTGFTSALLWYLHFTLGLHADYTRFTNTLNLLIVFFGLSHTLLQVYPYFPSGFTHTLHQVYTHFTLGLLHFTWDYSYFTPGVPTPHC